MKCNKCTCHGFDSYFAYFIKKFLLINKNLNKILSCISCDERWEHHVTLFETEMDRVNEKKPIR